MVLPVFFFFFFHSKSDFFYKRLSGCQHISPPNVCEKEKKHPSVLSQSQYETPPASQNQQRPGRSAAEPRLRPHLSAALALARRQRPLTATQQSSLLVNLWSFLFSLSFHWPTTSSLARHASRPGQTRSRGSPNATEDKPQARFALPNADLPHASSARPAGVSLAC